MNAISAEYFYAVPTPCYRLCEVLHPCVLATNCYHKTLKNLVGNKKTNSRAPLIIFHLGFLFHVTSLYYLLYAFELRAGTLTFDRKGDGAATRRALGCSPNPCKNNDLLHAQMVDLCDEHLSHRHMMGAVDLLFDVYLDQTRTVRYYLFSAFVI